MMAEYEVIAYGFPVRGETRVRQSTGIIIETAGNKPALDEMLTHTSVRDLMYAGWTMDSELRNEQ
jgi:hypothetical protein